MSSYVEAFLTKKPKEGLQIVETRLKDAMALDIEVAEYFKERAQIEEEYAQKLSKASKRLYTMDPMILGYFAPIWEALLKELNQVSKYHSDMGYKITHEIEKPLRTSPCNDYQRLQQLEPIIQNMEKSSKFPSVKGTILRKSKNTNSSASWKNEGAEYLSLHQKIDEARLKRLKQSVEHFEKIQSDELMNRVNMATAHLSLAEAFDINHDINDFCTERGRGLNVVHSSLDPAPSFTTTPTPTNNNNSLPRERPSTSISNDSHRSNKFKSLFIKKQKSFDQDDTNYAEMNNTSPTTSQPTIDSRTTSQHTNNHNPLVDTEGYSIPTFNYNYPNTVSDISSRNTSDDVDSDFQSLSLNQKFKVNIKDDVVQEETDEATETFNKMATMLRERTPTIARRPRGRRESAILRSQSDLSSGTISRSQSMLLINSSPTNPFTLIEQQSHTGVQSTDTLMHLQSIPEQKPTVSISIHEKTSMQSPNVLTITGQIYVSSSAPVPLNLQHMDGITRVMANPDYITTLSDGTYQFTRTTDQPVSCFTYEFNTSALALPIRLMPSWKCVEGVTYLMLKHEKNVIIDLEHLSGAIQIEMQDVVQVQSTPQGIWDVSRKQLTWNLKDVVSQYQSQEQLRLLAKFYLEGQGLPQPIHLHYKMKDSLVSGIIVTSEGADVSTETMVQSENIVYL